jgi:hypothetical protein
MARPPARASSLARRAGMRALEVALLALALLVVPACIQHVVRALDTLSEVAGRRARTAWDDVSWWRVVVGGGVLAAWHAGLIALSFEAFAGHGRGRRRGSRVLGRVLVPAYLVVALVALFYTLATRLAAPLSHARSSTPHG